MLIIGPRDRQRVLNALNRRRIRGGSAGILGREHWLVQYLFPPMKQDMDWFKVKSRQTLSFKTRIVYLMLKELRAFAHAVRDVVSNPCAPQ
jgi:hypothetical protein